jgi:hypothetical protein
VKTQNAKANWFNTKEAAILEAATDKKKKSCTEND